LYAQLKDSSDERIQIALDELLEEHYDRYKWIKQIQGSV